MKPPLPSEVEAAKQRLLAHLEMIEGFSDCSNRSLFTQQDKDIITMLRALGVKT